MKKIYTLIAAVCVAASVNAQEDLTCTLDNYTAGASVSDDPLLLDFTITNNGGTVATGDSIFWAFQMGSNYYSTIDLASGFVVFTELTADFANGESFGVDGADIPMDFIYGEIGLTGDVCAVVIGIGSASLSTISDTNPADNVECVSYTVTEVASIEDLNASIGKVYVYDNMLRIENNLEGYVDNAQVTITNIAGQIVQQENNLTLQSGNNDIMLDETSTGMYLINITANGESTTKKVVIR